VVDLLFFHDERWRDGDGVAGVAHHHALVKTLAKHLRGSGANGAIARGQFYAGHQAKIAYVDHVPRAFQRMGGIFKGLRQASRALEQPVAFINA
jgi:hypothetical protein